MTKPAKSNSPGVAVIQQTKPFRLEESDGIARLFLHGKFESVEDNTKLVSDLHDISKKFNIIEVWVSSDGGYVTILTEIIEALRNFKTVVTICNSSASSAGAMIWSLGDIRVVSPFSQLMWHRESYGYYGKTNQHEDVLESQKKVFPILMEYCVGDILTQEEKDKAMYTEIHKSGKEMIESGFAIEYQDYQQRVHEADHGRFSQIGIMYYDNLRQVTMMSTPDGMVSIVGAIDTSPYRASFYDIGVADNIRVELPNHDDMMILSAEEYCDMEQKYFDDVSEKYKKLEEEVKKGGTTRKPTKKRAVKKAAPRKTTKAPKEA